MIVFHHPTQSETAGLVLLFGTGLIGTSVFNSISRRADWTLSCLPFDWRSNEQGHKDADGIFQYISGLRVSLSLVKTASMKIAFVWCAGKAGFSATEKEMDNELASYDNFLNLVRRVRDGFPGCKIFLHLLSSAGGLFEGQRLIHEETIPQPKRIYGHLKHVQEQRLLELGDGLTKKIYRPTSVYGFIGPGQRMGLIATLIANGIRNRVSTLIGSFSTLRDYVLNDDIGAYLEKKLFDDDERGAATFYLLGSGKPCSIYEIRYFVEQVVGRKIYLEFRHAPQTENSMDITLNSSALAVDWSPTDTKSGIRYVKEGILSGKVSRVPAKEVVAG